MKEKEIIGLQELISVLDNAVKTELIWKYMIHLVSSPVDGVIDTELDVTIYGTNDMSHFSNIHTEDINITTDKIAKYLLNITTNKIAKYLLNI